jgi:hypothetical protein
MRQIKRVAHRRLAAYVETKEYQRPKQEKGSEHIYELLPPESKGSGLCGSLPGWIELEITTVFTTIELNGGQRQLRKFAHRFFIFLSL